MIAAARDLNLCRNRKSSNFFNIGGSTTKLRNGLSLGMTNYTHTSSIASHGANGYNGYMEQWKPVVGFDSYSVEVWLRRWIANFEGSPDDIAILEDAIKIVQAVKP